MRRRESGDSIFNGGKGFSPGDDILPPELLKAQSTLADLANVFFTNGSLNDTSAEHADAPGLTDVYRILVEQIPAVVFIAFFDKSFGEAYVSPQIEQALGFTQEEWLNDPIRWYERIHPEDKDRWSTEAAQMFLTGEPLHSVYRVLARDKREVWFQCEVKMVRRDDGQPWFIHGIGFDVTEQKLAGHALGKSEEMLRGIFEYAPDTMVVVDGRGIIERVNTQVERMFGYSRDELVGQPVELLIPQRFEDKHRKHRAAYASDPHLRPMGAGLKLFGERKDGSEFPVEIMLSPVMSEAGGLVIAVIRDITRRQRNEEALQEYAERMEVLSRSLINVQEAERRNIALELHDQIGQMLTGLKLKLEMLVRTQKESAPQFGEAQELVNELILRTREMSLDLRPATLDHLGLLAALHRHLRHYTAQTNVQVNFKHDGLKGRRFQPELETAAFRIVQEGLTNIARHSGSPDASVRIYAVPKKLTIEISDHGIGFDQQKALAVGQSSGLAGMRERAMLLGGSFTVESGRTGTRLTAEWELPTLGG